VLTSSYSSYYRRMLLKLLGAIEFKCNNTAYRLRRLGVRDTALKV
jgi:hypothetical protein